MGPLFLCPQCGAFGLKVVKAMDLPPDSRSDDVMLQIIECNSCSFKGLALYEESRRGGMDDESFDHTGFWVSDEAVSEVEDIFSLCSSLGDKRCNCIGHKRAVAATSTGKKWRLALLDQYGCEQTFVMKLR
jgi:hypothetical protein